MNNSTFLGVNIWPNKVTNIFPWSVLRAVPMARAKMPRPAKLGTWPSVRLLNVTLWDHFAGTVYWYFKIKHHTRWGCWGRFMKEFQYQIHQGEWNTFWKECLVGEKRPRRYSCGHLLHLPWRYSYCPTTWAAKQQGISKCCFCCDTDGEESKD